MLNDASSVEFNLGKAPQNAQFTKVTIEFNQCLSGASVIQNKTKTFRSKSPRRANST